MSRLHQFTRPISPTCDQYVQYVLAEPTHRSLTDTGRGYNLGGVVFPQHTPALPNQQSQINQPTITN
jgi:hypothetical protein